MLTRYEYCVDLFYVADFAFVQVHAKRLEEFRHQEWDWGPVEELVPDVANHVYFLLKLKFFGHLNLLGFLYLCHVLHEPVLFLVLQEAQLTDGLLPVQSM